MIPGVGIDDIDLMDFVKIMLLCVRDKYAGNARIESAA